VDSPLLSLIQAKYPRQVRREIKKEYGNKSTIMQFLDRAEAILRREGKYAATEQKKQREGPPAGNPKDHRRNASAFAASKKGQKHKDSEPIPVVSVAQRKDGSKGKKKGGEGGKPNILLEFVCPICKVKGSHFTGRCPKLLDLPVEERKKTVKNHGLCKKCLRKVHEKKEDCPTKTLPCKKKTSKGTCGSFDHHFALHQ